MQKTDPIYLINEALTADDNGPPTELPGRSAIGNLYYNTTGYQLGNDWFLEGSWNGDTWFTVHNFTPTADGVELVTINPNVAAGANNIAQALPRWVRARWTTPGAGTSLEMVLDPGTEA